MSGHVAVAKPSYPRLWRWFVCDRDQVEQTREHRTGVSMSDLAEAIGFESSTVRKWANRGHVPFAWADTIAIRLGVHPVDIWPEWYEIPVLDDELVA